MTLIARTPDGSAPSAASLDQAAEIIRKRVAHVGGAEVTVDPPRTVTVTAPGSDPTILSGLSRAAVLNLRPVIAQWINPAVISGTGGGSSGASPTADPSETGAAVSENSLPPMTIFPSGSDPDVPTQPAGDASDTESLHSWVQAASALSQSGGGPNCEQIAHFRDLDDADKPLLACDEGSMYVYLLDATVLPGTEIASASSRLDDMSGWTIDVEFKAAGFTTLSTYIAGHIGSQLAFTLDSEVLSAPAIQDAITTPSMQVSGNFTEQSATSLADALNFGALPLEFDVEQTVVN